MVGIIRLVVGERKGEIEYCLCVRMEDNVVFLTATDIEFVDRISELYKISVSGLTEWVLIATYIDFDSLKIDSEIIGVRYGNIDSEVKIERIRSYLEL